jgi:transposase
MSSAVGCPRGGGSPDNPSVIAGQRDPQVLAGLARGKMRARHDRLAGALEGRFDDHHGELARMLLDQIDALTAHIDTITSRVTFAGHRPRGSLPRRG